MSIDTDIAEFDCSEELAQQSKTNFYYSFTFLPKDEREAIHTVYAFCRHIDDIVDEEDAGTSEEIIQKRKKLADWRKVIDQMYAGKPQSTYLKPLQSAIKRFSIPKQYFMTLIDGCERDLRQKRYETFTELKEYCYGVAGIVGLMCIEIFGYKYEETKEYAVNLGYALQLTNILRDLKADKDRGYIYLPREDMEKFRYSESDLMNEVYNEQFIELMRYETRRAREYYHKARTALRPDERMTMIAAEIMDAIYYRLLEKIELNDFDVFKKQIRVSTIHKIAIAFKHWISTRIFVGRIKH